MMKSKVLIAIILMVATLCCTSTAKLFHPDDPAFIRQAPPEYKVQLETTKGSILMEIKREWSPNGADRFYNLVRYGYYNNAPVFRIRAGLWAQFGIAANAKVAQAWRNKTIPDDPRKESNARGTVAYAFKDRNGRTTQVFINLRDNSPTHDVEPFVPFAKVINGMEVADALYAGYGERSGGGIRAGHQDSAFAGGGDYFRKNFPLLDYILKAHIVKE